MNDSERQGADMFRKSTWFAIFGVSTLVAIVSAAATRLRAHRALAKASRVPGCDLEAIGTLLDFHERANERRKEILRQRAMD